MKTISIKFIFSLALSFFLLACSTKKDKFSTRNFQALNTKYNVLFNGDMALESGIKELKTGYNDNFWAILPVERMQVTEPTSALKDTKNPNFEKSETKAIKAIQKRSMLIGGTERNPQIDEAHLLLGKSRYYDQRFIPALEAFNYILYKSPNSDKIYEAKIWREKTNIRLQNEGLAIGNLTQLINGIKHNDQLFADAHASLAQAYLNTDDTSCAIESLQLASAYTKSNEEKARYQFILGQLHQSQKTKDSAWIMFQNVIAMNRRAPKRYVIQAHINQAKQFDYSNGDTQGFLETFDKLINDPESKPYRDAIYHHKGKIYEHLHQNNEALTNYKLSLKNRSKDSYQIASNYRNIAEIYFYKANYQESGKYFDSTLVVLSPKTREYDAIKKKRENLDDVIKYETIAQKNDSILQLLALSESERLTFFETHIANLKKEAETKAKAEREATKKQALAQGQEDDTVGGLQQTGASKTTTTAGAPSTFYFYIPTNVIQGKIAFAKQWGTRSQQGYWRLSSAASKTMIDQAIAEQQGIPGTISDLSTQLENPQHQVSFYLAQLPKTIQEKDSIAKERNFAYYQLGMLYKEKFKENEMATQRLEMVLKGQPDDRLVLPSMYSLYKLYQSSDEDKALQMKNAIINQYPTSRYAQILSNSVVGSQTLADDPEEAYGQLYKIYEKGDYRAVYFKLEEAIVKFTGESIVSKLELLRATVNGKLKGLQEYKNGLNDVALNFPNSQEGKESEAFLRLQIPKLEQLELNQEAPSSWKILFVLNNLEDPSHQALQEKATKFIEESGKKRLTTSVDSYTLEENLFVIHGIKSQTEAVEIATILSTFKTYKVQEAPLVISNENYKVVQIKKSLSAYIANHYIPIPKNAVAPAHNATETQKPASGPSKGKPTQQLGLEKAAQSSKTVPASGGTKKS